jgi:hypothetical protein
MSWSSKTLRLRSKGRFVDTGGRKRKRTFAFVSLDLYTGPVGSASPYQQIHNYNVHVDRNAVFWMIELKSDAVDVDFDEGRARLRVAA